MGIKRWMNEPAFTSWLEVPLNLAVVLIVAAICWAVTP